VFLTIFSLQRGMKAILALDYSPLNGTVATGNTDRHVRLWDPRSTGESMVLRDLLLGVNSV